MNKKLLFAAVVLVSGMLMFNSCGGGDTENKDNTASTEKSADATTSSDAPKSMVDEPPTYDPKRGEGKFDASNVNVAALDNAMATKGEAIAGTKCTSCHKLTDEKLVGPGWMGVTTRRTPHWIMNFITNPDPMINKDPEVQAQLELCLVRMPNQSLTDDDARSVLEFMRKNDGSK